MQQKRGQPATWQPVKIRGEKIAGFLARGNQKSKGFSLSLSQSQAFIFKNKRKKSVLTKNKAHAFLVRSINKTPGGHL